MNIKFALLITCFSVFTLASCDKEENNNAPEYINITYYPTADDVLQAQAYFGAFVPHEVEGEVKIYKNSYHQVLRFEDFLVDNGPEMRVYLSKAQDNIDEHINLGELKAASGNFNYTFNVYTDLNEYKHVIVRSEKQNTNYCVANL